MSIRIGSIIGLFLLPLASIATENRWSLGRDGVLASDKGGRQVVVLPGWQWADAPYACPPALGVGPGGEALVTSNVSPTLLKVDPQTLRVTTHPVELDADGDKDVGFSSLRYVPNEGAWIAFSAAHGSFWRIDATLNRAQKMAHDPAWRMRCAIN